MLHKDIVRLYEQGIKEDWPDNKSLSYIHYIIGETSTTFKYVKFLYEEVMKDQNFEQLKTKRLKPEEIKKQIV